MNLKQLARVAHDHPETRPLIMPYIRRASSGDRTASSWRDLPGEMTRQAFTDLWATLLPGVQSKVAAALGIKTARPVSIQRPDVMLYAIDHSKNQSKFYEMRVVPYGSETRAKRTKDFSRGAAGYVLERRWGRLTDSGASGRVDSINDLFSDEYSAQNAMRSIRSDKMRGSGSAAYTDVTRKGEYPIGLGSAGFGWGGQAVCRVIPELQSLLGHVREAQGELHGLAREDNAVASKVKSYLDPLQSYLEDQLAHCR